MPVRQTTWPPRSTDGSVSALITKSGRPAADQSRFSARGAALSRWPVESFENLSDHSARIAGRKYTVGHVPCDDAAGTDH